MSRNIVKPLGAAVGLALFGTSALAGTGNPFLLNDLGSGYQIVGEEGKCGEGKCGEGKCGEGKCGEGKCGEGKCGEGKCGEGRCGMEVLDADGNGIVTRAEWDAAGKPAERFAEADTDGDGQLSAAEVQACHEAHAGKDGEGKCGEGKCGEGRCGGLA